MVRVLRELDASWIEGESCGQVGTFPSNYVELYNPDTQCQTVATVAEDFETGGKYPHYALTLQHL